MDGSCKKCGGLLKPKGYVYYSGTKDARYKRFRCASCNAVEYVPQDNRDVKDWDWVCGLFKQGKLEVWHQGKKWEVK